MPQSDRIVNVHTSYHVLSQMMMSTVCTWFVQILLNKHPKNLGVRARMSMCNCMCTHMDLMIRYKN